MLGRPPPRFPPKEPLEVPIPPVVSRHTSLQHHQLGMLQDKSCRLGYYYFDGTNFRAWWSKLEQFFEAEAVLDNDNLCTIMLNLEGRALDWHYFHAQKHRGL